MASPAVTYTFANSTTADATQVNQNFTDLINGLTDGTKDLSISALTCAGTATLNGNVAIGNSSSDTLTITAVLSSSLAMGTTFSYDFGAAAVGLRSVYLGSNDSAARTVRVIAGAVPTSYTLTLPTTPGAARDVIESDGSGGLSFQPKRRSSADVQNYSLAAAVAASALTITLNGANGSAPSATNPVDIVFRSATSATGTPVTRTATSAPTLTISSGSTLGQVSATAEYIYVYAIDNAGTIELAASTGRLVDEASVVTTTAEGGGGAADDRITLYSTTARSGVAVRLIGRILSTQATAGTWASAVTEISLLPIPYQGFLGSKAGTTPAAGNVGEPLTASANVTVSSGSITAVASLTLTPGVWLVSGTYNNDNNATQTGFDAYFYQKGTNAGVQGVDKLLARYAAAQAHVASFSPRILVIAAADATKTIEIRAQAVTANQSGFGYLSAVRMP